MKLPKSCDHKAKHKTEEDALAAAVRSSKRRDAKMLRVYKCRECEYWHLTSKRNR